MGALTWASAGLAAALVAALLASALLPQLPPIVSGAWGGVGELASESIPAASPSQLLMGRPGAAVVVYPQLLPTPAEASALREFVESGGTLLVAGSGPAVNALLSAVGSCLSTLNGTVEDETLNYGAPNFVAAYFGGAAVALYNASPIDLSSCPGASALAATAPSSFAVAANGTRVRGPFVVAAEQRLGLGRVILVSSPYALSNGALNYTGNSELLEYATGGLRPYLVEFLWYRPPYSLLGSYARALAPYRAWLALATSLAAGLAAYSLRGGGRRGGEALEDIIARHPGWDRRLLEELAREREERLEGGGGGREG